MPIKTLDPGLRQDDDVLSRQPMSRHPGIVRYRVNDYLSRQPMSRRPGVGRDPLFFSSVDTQSK
jgi:hypothetical protein